MSTAPSARFERDRRQKALAAFQRMIHETTNEELAATIESCVTLLFSSLRDAELDLLRHRTFGRQRDVEKAEERLERMQGDRKRLSALAYFIRFLPIELPAAFNEALDAMEADLAALEVHIASQET